jgi:zinc protease
VGWLHVMIVSKRTIPFLLVSLMVITATASGSIAAQSEISQKILSNGLEVVVIPDRRAPVVTHIVWYRIGAADEPRGKSGIAHFLEHLMFKGTEKIAPGEFSKIVARNGGQDNAFTTQDVTAYFQRVATDRLPLVMEMEADRMTNLQLLADDVANERQVVLEERRSRVDNDPNSILSEQMGATLFLSHPYRIPIIGWEHEIKGLTQTDAVSFYKRYYAPNNAIVVVAGDVEAEDVFALAEKTYGALKASADLPPRARVLEPDPQAPRRVILKDERVAQDTLSRQYLAPSIRTAEGREAEALELLADILGSNATGRLYRRLVVEEKIASSAGGWYSGDYLDYGRMGVYAVAAGDIPLATVEASIDAVIAEVKENGVTAAELERARNSKIAQLIYDQDSQFNQARTYGWALATGQTIDDVKDRAARLEAVTLADIVDAAKKYFDLKRSVTGELLAVNKALARSGTPSTPGPSETIH